MEQKLIITCEELTVPGTYDKKNFRIAALYEDGHMLEVSMAPDGMEEAGILNNIYIARVQNVVGNLNAAFVEIEKGQLCFLPMENLVHPFFTHKPSKKKIAQGDELLVQVVREAVGKKEPVVTANISIAGEYMVLTSGNHTLGVSSKVAKEERIRLQALGEGLKKSVSEKEGFHPPEFGIVMRTNSAGASGEQLQQEFYSLYSEYAKLFYEAPARTRFSCMRKAKPFYLKMLQDQRKAYLHEVVTDDAAVFAQLREAAVQSAASGEAGFAIRFYSDPMLSLARAYSISQELERACRERVWLKSGANIVIQHTEALTVIDVNSGKNVAKKEKKQNHFKINLEAAQEIARQLRLRNISGMVIIDFINLHDQELDKSLLQQFGRMLKQDPVPVQLVDMTRLGLVEVTRKKVRRSLAELF